MANPTIGLVITVMTEQHVSAETWYVTQPVADALRAELGEPAARQLVPIELTDAVIDDPRHIGLVNLGSAEQDGDDRG